MSVLQIFTCMKPFSIASFQELPICGAQVRKAALPPLLALLPVLASAGNQYVATSHCLIVHVHDIIARVPNLLKNEHESLFLFEMLCKVLDALFSSLPELWTTDIHGQDGRDLLVEDLDFIFRFIGKWNLAKMITNRK